MLTLIGFLAKPGRPDPSISQKMEWISQFAIVWLDVYLIASILMTMYGVQEFLNFQKYVCGSLLVSGIIFGSILTILPTPAEKPQKQVIEPFETMPCESEVDTEHQEDTEMGLGQPTLRRRPVPFENLCS